MGLNPWRGISKIRSRYALKFVSALIVVVLVVGAFGGHIYAHTGEELRSDVRDQLVTDAEQDANRLDVWFDLTERYALSLPRSTAFRSDDAVGIADALHRMNERTAFEGAYYVDPATGEVDVRAGTTDPIDEQRLNDRIRKRLSDTVDDSNRVGFSEAFETEQGRSAMLLVSKVPGQSDRVIVGLVDLEALSKHVIGEDQTADVVVLDASGTVVLAEDRDAILRDDVLDADRLVNATGVTSIDTAGETAGGNGEERELEVGYATLENSEWLSTTRVPAADAYSLQADISNQILVMLLVVFGSMVVLGATIGRNTASSIRTLSEKASRVEAGTLDEPIESDRRDELGDLYRSVDEMRHTLRSRLEESRTARAEAERARTESERFTERLERTADEYGEAMRACADDDLTRRLDPDDESEAMARIATEFNAMMNDIEATVGATRAFAEVVDEASESTAHGAAEVRSASERVTTSIQQIADGADRQSEHLSAVGEKIDDLSTSTQQIAAASSEVATLAERTARRGTDARKSAQRAIDGMNAIEREATDAVDEVERLEDELEAIDDLLAFIGEVTRETNLLALNASIEASRSVDVDSGFTAVAEEVKRLAEETQEAAADIETRLERLEGQTTRVVDVVRETDERISTHRSAVEASVTALEEISSFADRTNDGIQEISAASDQQATATQEVVTMTDDVTAISEETSAEAETVAAAAEEQTASVVDVSRNAETLSERARELSDLLSSFDVSSDVSIDASSVDDVARVRTGESVDESEMGIEREGASDRRDDGNGANGGDEPSPVPTEN